MSTLDQLRNRLPRRTGAPRSDIAVIGLGRFGAAVAQTLFDSGQAVIAIDADPKTVASLAGQLAHVVEADGTDPNALRQVGVADCATAVVGCGSDMEVSILTVSALTDLDVPCIWAKAMTPAHARILERVGAHRIISPENDMGVRVAHRLASQLLDYIQLDVNFAIVETVAPAHLHGRSLAQSQIRQRFGVTVVSVKPNDGQFTYATADTTVNPGDLLLVAGPPDAAERFASSR